MFTFAVVLEKNDQYKTIKRVSEGFYKEKGSKFTAFAIPCNSADQAKIEIEKLRKGHPNACHVCFAWRFGTAMYADRYSDDGEPNNSAGKPIHGQIIAFDLTNILIAVVRYYGGTNLGVGGLITAYKTSAKLSLQNAKIHTETICNHYKIVYPYDQTGTVMGILHQLNTTVVSQNFDHINPSITVSIARALGERLEEKINSNKNITINHIQTVE